MSSSFNLVREPFIPVLGAAGPAEVSLREALLRAHELREVRASSPLVTIALHRLLLTILHRNLGPEDGEAWKRLYEAGQFPVGALEDYFRRWEDRFDLFHTKYPFFQDPTFQAKQASSVNLLVRELSRGNNAALFDHTFEEPAPLLPLPAVAKALIAEQMFAVGGGNSDRGYTTSAPLTGGVVVLVLGDNLFETLMLNLVLNDEDNPMPRTNKDAPVWERDNRPLEDPQTPHGYLDYLTWQSRSIRLCPEPGGVRSVSFAKGRKLAPAGNLFDPMMAYLRDESAGFSPIRLSEGKSLWRESSALLQFAPAETSRRPGTLDWLASLRRQRHLPTNRQFRIAAIGLCTDKAKVHFWRHETLPLPAQYLADPALLGALKQALAMAEAVARWVRIAAAETAAHLLSADGKSPDRRRQWEIVDALAADKLYWSRLEQPFRHLLESRLPGDEDHQGREVVNWFRADLVSQAHAAFQDRVEDIGTEGRKQKAIVNGQALLNKSLAKVAREFHISSNPESGGTA